MKKEDSDYVTLDKHQFNSSLIGRNVTIDIYKPIALQTDAAPSLLLINDGQDLLKMDFANTINGLLRTQKIEPLICIGIHASDDRRNEYGTAKLLDYEGRGTKAAAYQQFIMEELLPYIQAHYNIEKFGKKGFAGFSLGGLSAIDTVWNHVSEFTIAGVFSGSLWWRTKSLEDGYDEERDRIMHHQIRQGNYQPHLNFYFTTGSLDETADRNNNGIIDSIDDTLGLITELEKKGYRKEHNIHYINYEDGRHDVETWARALPQFLMWGWGTKEHQLLPSETESC